MAKLFYNSLSLSKWDCGIYGILNKTNGKIYIGGSKNLASRKRGHCYDFLHGQHAAQDLQRDILNNPAAFEFVLIETVSSPDVLLNREQFWMDFYKSYEPRFGYNTNSKSDSCIGVLRRGETKERLSQSHRGPRINRRKKVIQIDLNNRCVAEHDSITQASKAVGFSRPNGNIVSVCRGNQITAYGFKWKYA